VQVISRSFSLLISEFVKLKSSNIFFRIQEERFESEQDYRKACENYVINDKTMHRAKPGMRVLHPLPRKFEISTDFDTDERAAYFRQAENGLYVRMALLAMVLGAW
jgi:aspartate carbamoyltransferase catalytic subunit